jgi:hypothetical protein
MILMSEINQEHIETKTIITLFVVKGYTCCFKSEAFASFVSIALHPWLSPVQNDMISAYEQAKVEEVYIKSKSQHIIIYFA